MKRRIAIMMNRINLLALLPVLLMMACSELDRWQYPTDDMPPGQVSNVVVENIPGGAIISYTVPNDDDLLYVRVEYTMSDGTRVEQKSSAYTPKVLVEGLGRSQRQTVQLICGDRSGNESAPYPVEIEPLDAPIYDIFETVQIAEDFGGVKITWDNPLKASVVITIYVLDELNRFVETQSVYSNSSTGKYNLRGFPPEEVTFGVSVRDRWKNITELTAGTYIPFFEEQLDRLKFTRWNPPGIPYLSEYGGWPIERIWDGVIGDQGYLTLQPMPVSITFNMGQRAFLNRIHIYQRLEPNFDSLYNYYNPRKFSFWGSTHPNVNEDFATWVFLGEFESYKPSGLPLGQTTDEDLAFAQAGEDFIIEVNNNVPIQYIRMHTTETWGGGAYFNISEIEFYGQIENEQ